MIIDDDGDDDDDDDRTDIYRTRYYAGFLT